MRPAAADTAVSGMCVNDWSGTSSTGAWIALSECSTCQTGQRHATVDKYGSPNSAQCCRLLLRVRNSGCLWLGSSRCLYSSSSTSCKHCWIMQLALQQVGVLFRVSGANSNMSTAATSNSQLGPAESVKQPDFVAPNSACPRQQSPNILGCQ